MANDSAPPIPAVQTYGLSRTYGAMTALSALDLTVNQGDLFGFIGSNGAGKTTTLRILATFLAPSAGRAEVLGHDVVIAADAVRHVIGYMQFQIAFRLLIPVSILASCLPLVCLCCY